MRFLICFYVVFVLGISASMAQTPTPAPTASPAPVEAPLAEVTGPKPVPAIVKDESMAPPVWMQDIVVQAKALPVVGPYVVKIGQVIFFCLTILTALTTCLVSILGALKALSDKAGFDGLYSKADAFQKSKFMYWLKYASLAFNAQKTAKLDQRSEEARA